MSTNLNIRTDVEVKENAEKIFEQLGLNLSSAINMFLRAAIRENGIPFEVKLEIPNATTKQAIEEGRQIANDSNAKGFSDVKSLMAALDE